ncbi:MAG: isoprenylcysteine carboxylmethyltransferase family protein [bacterium]|nr:isoprenylcysteine carboxylmethyltransferase family protein [bacterium]
MLPGTVNSPSDENLRVSDGEPGDRPAAERLAERLGKWLFRHRGILPVPFILLLILLGDPRPWSWAVGLPLIFLGEALRFWGVGHAGGATRARDLRAHALCTRGPFAHLRNPLYLGNTLMALGTVTVGGVWFLMAVQPLLYTVYYHFIIRFEEPFLVREFGAQYACYRRAVRRFIPRLAPYPERSGRDFSASDALYNERRTLTGQGVILVLLLVLGIVLARMGAADLWTLFFH